jgi:hypothetical protein
MTMTMIVTTPEILTLWTLQMKLPILQIMSELNRADFCVIMKQKRTLVCFFAFLVHSFVIFYVVAYLFLVFVQSCSSH